jgi:hypothetical protein
MKCARPPSVIGRLELAELMSRLDSNELGLSSAEARRQIETDMRKRVNASGSALCGFASSRTSSAVLSFYLHGFLACGRVGSDG